MKLQQWGVLNLAAGFSIWLAALSLLYGVQAMGCTLSWETIFIGPMSLLRIMLIGIAASQVALLAWLFAYSRKTFSADDPPLSIFLWRGASYLTLAALAATLWIASALTVPSIC